MTKDQIDQLKPCYCGNKDLEVDCTNCSEYGGKLVQHEYIMCKECEREEITSFDHNIDGDMEQKEAELIAAWNANSCLES